MPASFHFLDDVALADLAFDAEGDSVQEMFEAASNAVMEAMADPKTVGATWERRVEHTGPDLAELLFCLLYTSGHPRPGRQTPNSGGSLAFPPFDPARLFRIGCS